MTQPVALTRGVSPALATCQLTHVARVAIDVDRASRQHAAYETAIGDAGYRVIRLPGSPEMPDCVFIEDTAIVLDEIAIVTRPGAVSRREETAAVADELSRHRALRFIEAPGTVDGGDVLVVGRDLFIGRSTRTNGPGIDQIRRLASSAGYSVHEAEVIGCLHLKSAVTALDARTLLVDPVWIDTTLFEDFRIVAIDARERGAANVLRLRDRVIVPAAFPRTAERIGAAGHRVVTVDVGELAKAEGAVTCCSLIVEFAQ
jgi:dimethylargininase